MIHVIAIYLHIYESGLKHRFRLDHLPTTKIPYIIKGGLHAYAFLLNLFMMAGPNQDIFTTLLSPKLRNNIASFVASHYQFALSTNQAFSLQSRFLVTNISINKAGMPAQHGSFTLWVFDKVTLERHKFFIKCVPSNRSYASRFSAFSQISLSLTASKRPYTTCD